MKGPALIVAIVIAYSIYLASSFYSVWAYEKSCIELGGEFHFRKGNRQECLDPLTKTPMDDTSSDN